MIDLKKIKKGSVLKFKNSTGSYFNGVFIITKVYFDIYKDLHFDIYSLKHQKTIIGFRAKNWIESCINELKK